MDSHSSFVMMLAPNLPIHNSNKHHRIYILIWYDAVAQYIKESKTLVISVDTGSRAKDNSSKRLIHDREFNAKKKILS